MACGCSKRSKQSYLWYKDEATEPVIYKSINEARAKVIRKQGYYTPYDPNTPIGTQIAVAEARRVAAG